MTWLRAGSCSGDGGRSEADAASLLTADISWAKSADCSVLLGSDSDVTCLVIRDCALAMANSEVRASIFFV
ncbi:hypothetical protein G6F68_021756 [Rhizopus microsporus]|nr:hypothetical protein G6F68_021756 [Rhizopus microsporus]